MHAISVTDTPAITDYAKVSGRLGIIVKQDSTLLGGSIYSISPNPLTGTGSLSITDNGVNDSNSTAGILSVLPAIVGSYTITMTTVPSGFTTTSDSTILSLRDIDPHQEVTFQLLSSSVTATSSPIIGTTAPVLNDTQYGNFTSLNAKIVSSTTSAPMTDDHDLPELILIGKLNTAELQTAINNQNTTKLDKSIARSSSGSSIQSQLGIPEYTLPTTSNFTAIIPSYVTNYTLNNIQIVSTPPFGSLTAGQTMIIPVKQSVLPNYGGMKQLSIQSSSSVSGLSGQEWITIEIDNKLVSEPALPDQNQLNLLIDVKYPYEENISGKINWGNQSNYAQKPQMTVLIPIPTSSNTATLSNGCADVQVLTLVGSTWNSSIDTILSNKPSTTSGFCEVVFESNHYSKKSISSHSSTSGSTSSSSGSTSGSGKTGVGPSGSGRGLGGFGGILSTPLTINEINYDRCEENMATILVSSDADIAPTVTVHTAKSGSVLAKLADIQPYEQSNKITKLDKHLYEISIASDETFLMIVVTEEKGVFKNTVQSAVHLTSCEGSTVISKIPEEKHEEISTFAPKIFDIKFQIENNTQQRSETESEFYYVDNQDLSISAIIDAQTPLQRSELRIITMGQPQEEYVAIPMNTKSLPISNSTYVVNTTIPSYLMQEPAISYWIHVIDEAQNEVESKQYNIGVKPISVGDISFEMDITSVKESGSLVRPKLFVDNKDLPSYGIVSLIVNGETISKKSQLFAIGETVVNLEWKSPHVDEHIVYDVMASVDLYDKSISTQSAKLHIYPKTITMLASEIKPLESITEDDVVLADPGVIYASNSADQNLRFHVVAPNGQCIIGASEECSIHDSTTNQRGGLTSIEYEDQIIRVRYSGPDSSLERFSITSIDPLANYWIVSLETSDGIVPQAQAMKDMSIKVKYRTHSETITVSSE